MVPGTWCPVFRPTIAEFSNFSAYIDNVIEPQCRSIGLCKIIPPIYDFCPQSYANINFSIPTPVSQHIAGKKGSFTVDLVERKSMDLHRFREIARQMEEDSPLETTEKELIERQFWRSLRSTMNAPQYGADIVGTLCTTDSKSTWHLNRLDTILQFIDLPGITKSMMYFGMWKAMFALHTEDMDLYSINYLHSGKPKFWYGIPPQYAEKVERVAAHLFPEKALQCQQFLRHKTSLISPSRLREFDVPYVRGFQEAGEFMITFPGSYHQGFNLGFNIAEAVNFASYRWIPKGLNAKLCKCRSSSVIINMDEFIGAIFRSTDASPTNQRCFWKEGDNWLFACLCGKQISNEDIDQRILGRSFECSKCSIWHHLGCIHPKLIDTPDEQLPDILLCHRCANAIQEQVTLPHKPKRTKRRRQRYKIGSKVTSLNSKFINAKIVDIDGDHVRLHYKGQTASTDEWIPRSRLQE